MSFGYCGSGAGVALYVGLHLNPKYQVYMCAYKNITAVSWLGDWLQRRLDWICEQYQMAGSKHASTCRLDIRLSNVATTINSCFMKAHCKKATE